MNRSAFTLFSVILLLATAPLSHGQNDGNDLLASESLGGIKIGLEEKALGTILGKSKVKKGKSGLEEATGEYIQTWTCEEKGLSLRMSSGENKKGTPQVAGFTADAKCPLATNKGIKIGSTKTEVLKAYGKFEDKENKAAAGADSFVAGSIYGGIIFTFEGDKVSEIFFGAGAE